MTITCRQSHTFLQSDVTWSQNCWASLTETSQIWREWRLSSWYNTPVITCSKNMSGGIWGTLFHLFARIVVCLSVELHVQMREGRKIVDRALGDGVIAAFLLQWTESTGTRQGDNTRPSQCTHNRQTSKHNDARKCSTDVLEFSSGADTYITKKCRLNCWDLMSSTHNLSKRWFLFHQGWRTSPSYTNWTVWLEAHQTHVLSLPVCLLEGRGLQAALPHPVNLLLQAVGELMEC